MNIQRWLIGTYSLLLQLYPPGFRKRFAPEMLELAAAAEPAEWPLIFGDTSVAIVRCWLEPPANRSTAVPAGEDAYVAIGGSTLQPSRLILGYVLTTAIVLGLCYVGSLGYLELPKCHPVAAENVSLR